MGWRHFQANGTVIGSGLLRSRKGPFRHKGSGKKFKNSFEGEGKTAAKNGSKKMECDSFEIKSLGKFLDLNVRLTVL